MSTSTARSNTPARGRTASDRVVETARRAIARIPRYQETKYSPRVAVPGTLLGLHLDIEPTQRRRALTTELQRRAGKYSLTTFFSGCGGDALGALWAGIGEMTSYNHWPEAVACHAVNMGGTHYVADLNQVRDYAGHGVMAGPGIGDPAHAELFGYSDLLWNSAPCTFSSGARTKGKESKADTRTDAQKKEAMKKSRGSFFSGLEFVAAHHPKAVITENVVQILKRPEMKGWMQLWEDYGYVTVKVFLNSMFVGPLDERTPQNRDRVYFVHIDKQYADQLDLTMTVEAECRSCRRWVDAVQTWKNGKTEGTYSTLTNPNQYLYTCPTCHERVEPPVRGLDTVIDLSIPGTPIAGRELGVTTLTRIQNGLDNLIKNGLPAQPLIVTQDRSNLPNIKPAKPWTAVGSTLTGRQVLGVATHPALLSGDTRPARRLPRAEECDFRMAAGTPELSGIAGFPRDYLWVGSKRDISLATGNAVSPRVAQFLWERTIAALP